MHLHHRRQIEIIASTLACCIVLFLTSSCAAKKQEIEVLPSVVEHDGELYYRPSYFREYDVDWEHGFQEGLGDVEVNGKWGFINSDGKIVIKPKFDQVVCPFTEGVSVVRTGAIINRRKAFFLTGRCKYIDKKGRVTIDNPMGTHFSEGLAAVCIPGKWKISLWEGTFSVAAPKYGAIDKKGKMVIPTKYNFIDSFSEGLAAFEDANEKYGYMNTKGEIVVEPRYHIAGPFSEGLAAVGMIMAGGEYAEVGFINKRGEEVIPLQYSSAERFSEGLAVVSKEGKCGYIDKSGRLVIPFTFDDAYSFSEGYAAVIVEGKIGYIDPNGEWVIKPKFEYFSSWETPGFQSVAPFFSSFSDGLAAVMVEMKWGYINKNGDFVIEPKFDLAGPFTEGFAKVAVGDKLGYIDKQGKYIWEPTR